MIPIKDILFYIISIILLITFLWMGNQIKEDTAHPCETCEKKIGMECVWLEKSSYVNAFPGYEKQVSHMLKNVPKT